MRVLTLSRVELIWGRSDGCWWCGSEEVERPEGFWSFEMYEKHLGLHPLWWQFEQTIFYHIVSSKASFSLNNLNARRRRHTSFTFAKAATVARVPSWFTSLSLIQLESNWILFAKRSFTTTIIQSLPASDMAAILHVTSYDGNSLSAQLYSLNLIFIFPQSQQPLALLTFTWWLKTAKPLRRSGSCHWPTMVPQKFHQATSTCHHQQIPPISSASRSRAWAPFADREVSGWTYLLLERYFVVTNTEDMSRWPHPKTGSMTYDLLGFIRTLMGRSGLTFQSVRLVLLPFTPPTLLSQTSPQATFQSQTLRKLLPTTSTSRPSSLCATQFYHWIRFRSFPLSPSSWANIPLIGKSTSRELDGGSTVWSILRRWRKEGFQTRLTASMISWPLILCAFQMVKRTLREW